MFNGINHKLIEHKWMPHNNFIELIRSMHLGMQLSYTESFNLIACDFIANGIPIVISDTINWGPDFYKASTIDMEDVIDKLHLLYDGRNKKDRQKSAYTFLSQYEKAAEMAWTSFIEHNKK